MADEGEGSPITAVHVLLGGYVLAALGLTMGPAPTWLVHAAVALSPISAEHAEDALNIAAVVPLGVLLPLVFPRLTLWATVVVIATAAAGVEVMQVLLSRSPQLSDVGLNSLGGVLGTVIFFTFVRRATGKRP